MISTKRLKPTFIQTGGGVPDGGTEHAGHAYWKSTITPYQAAAVNPAPPEPSLYARPVVLNLPSIVTKPYGVLRAKKPNVASLLKDLLKKQSVVGGPINTPPGGGGGPGGGDKELPAGGPGVPESDEPPPLAPADDLPPLLSPTESGPSTPGFGPRGTMDLRINTQGLVENNFGQLGSVYGTPDSEGMSEYGTPRNDGFSPMVQRDLINYPDLTFNNRQNFNTPYYQIPAPKLQLNNSTGSFNIDPLPVNTDLEQALELGITEDEMKQVEDEVAAEEDWAKFLKEKENTQLDKNAEYDDDLYDRLIKLRVPTNDAIKLLEDEIRIKTELKIKALKKKSAQIQKERQRMVKRKYGDQKLIDTNNPIKAKIITEPVQNVSRNVLKLAIETNNFGTPMEVNQSSPPVTESPQSPPSSGELYSPRNPEAKHDYRGAYIPKRKTGRRR